MTIISNLKTHISFLFISLIYIILVFSFITMEELATGSDGTLLFYPVTYAFKQALLDGQLPHWVTQIQAGFPLLADGQPSILYPLNLVSLWFLPTHIAYNLLIVLHGWLGLLFMYCWGCSLSNRHSTAALLALLFVIITPLFGANMPMIEAFVWVPLIFLVTEKSLRSGHFQTLWILAPLFTLQWLAGFPQIALYCVLSVSVYFVGRLFIQTITWKERLYWCIQWGGVVLLGLFMAAPLLFPTYELSLLSIRANGIEGSLIGEKSLLPLALSTFLLPATKTFWQQAGFGGGIYLGIIPFLVVLATVRKTNKPYWYTPICVMIMVTVVLAFGQYSPLFPIVRHIPGLSAFRVPSRFLFFAVFGLVTIFGWGWEHLFENINAQQYLFKLAIILYVVTSLIGYPLLLWLRPQLIALASDITFRYIVNDSYHLQSETYYLEKIDALYQSILDALWSWPDTIVPFIVLVTCWLLLRLHANYSHKWIYIAFAGLFLVDIITFVGGVKQGLPLTWIMEKPETAIQIEEASNDELCRLYTHTNVEAIRFQPKGLNLLPSNYNLLWGISSTGLYSPLGFHPYYQLTKEIGGVNLAFGLKPIPTEAITNNHDLLNYLNVCFLTSREELSGFPLIAQIDDLFLYRNVDALPRAFAVDEVLVLDDEDEWVTAVQNNAHILPNTAIMRTPISLTAGAAQTAQVQIQTYESQKVVLSVETEGTILLQLTDTYHSSWHATLNGEPIDILQTNAQFRGIVVPKGNHEIVFTFIPQAFQNGLYIASIAFILWIIALFYSQRLSDNARMTRTIDSTVAIK